MDGLENLFQKYQLLQECDHCGSNTSGHLPRSSNETQSKTPEMAVPCVKYYLLPFVAGNDVHGRKTTKIWKIRSDVPVNILDQLYIKGINILIIGL